MSAIVVTGTDTGVGKTVVAAMLTLALDAVYWKPVQSGIAEGTDAATVAALTDLGPEHFILERYLLKQPLSPHRAAELDRGRLLIVEGAGGVMVPLTRRTLFIDVFQRWGAPVIVCARTALGTINHTLLTIEALRRRHIPILGVVFVGEPVPDSERTICELGQVKRLGLLPPLPVLTAGALADAFASHFDREDFDALVRR